MIEFFGIYEYNGFIRLAVMLILQGGNQNSMTIEVGSVMEGTVTGITKFGAFVELAPGVDALLHVSQISREHVEKPSDVLSVGQEITAKIVDLNEEEKKISLSMKALEADRDEEDAVSVDYEADAE